MLHLHVNNIFFYLPLETEAEKSESLRILMSKVIDTPCHLFFFSYQTMYKHYLLFSYSNQHLHIEIQSSVHG